MHGEDRSQYFKNYPVSKGMAKAYQLEGAGEKIGEKKNTLIHARELGLFPLGMDCQQLVLLADLQFRVEATQNCGDLEGRR